VYLTFQGRTDLKHSHVFTYDESNMGSKHFCWDNAEEKSGLTNACNLINDDLNSRLKDIVLSNSVQADNILNDFANSPSEQEQENPVVKTNIVKACSEALLYAVSKCFSA